MKTIIILSIALLLLAVMCFWAAWKLYKRSVHYQDSDVTVINDMALWNDQSRKNREFINDMNKPMLPWVENELSNLN